LIDGKLSKYEFNLKTAFEACQARVSKVLANDPPVVNTIPKYVKDFTISITSH